MAEPLRGTRPKGKLTGTYGKVKTNLILHTNKGYQVMLLFMENKSISLKEI